jgi:hypothetical protein
MLGCLSLSLNAALGREVRIQMLKMAVLDRREAVEKKAPIDRGTMAGGRTMARLWWAPCQKDMVSY